MIEAWWDAHALEFVVFACAIALAALALFCGLACSWIRHRRDRGGRAR